jgi:hypothetical protein
LKLIEKFTTCIISGPTNLTVTAPPMSWQKTDAAPPAIFSIPNKSSASILFFEFLLWIKQIIYRQKVTCPSPAGSPQLNVV